MNDLQKRFWTEEMRRQTWSDYYKDRVVTEIRYSEIEIDGCCHDATAEVQVIVTTEKVNQTEDEKDAPRSVYLRYADDEIEDLVAGALAFERD